MACCRMSTVQTSPSLLTSHLAPVTLGHTFWGDGGAPTQHWRTSVVFTDRVRVGSWVEIEDGSLREGWRIVGVEDADAARRMISEECPLAQALLGHRAGDQVRVQGPEGRFPVTILHVR